MFYIVTCRRIDIDALNTKHGNENRTRVSRSKWHATSLMASRKQLNQGFAFFYLFRRVALTLNYDALPDPGN